MTLSLSGFFRLPMMSKTTKACVGVQSIEYKRQGPLPVDFTKKKNWFLQLCCFKQATRAVFLGYTPLLCLVELQLETGAKKNWTGGLGYIRYKKWFCSFLLICKVVNCKKCFPKR